MSKHSSPRIIIIFLITFILVQSATLNAAPFSLPDPAKLTYGPLKFDPPQPSRITMPNGLNVYIIENHELPVIKITLIVKSGTMYDPPGKEGVSELTATVMRTGGTLKMAPQALDETLDYYAATIEAGKGLEQVQWSLFSLKKDFEEVLGIFSQILRGPLFDEGRLKLGKDLKSEEIRRLADDPQNWAFKEFNRLLYQGNPRGRLPTLSTIKNIQKSDLVECHRRHYAPENMIMALSGDIRREDAEMLLRKSFGDWNAKGQIVPVAAPFKSFSPGSYYIVKETPQTIIVTGQAAPKKGSDAYYAFDVIDFVLGSGGFRSRIFQEVRTNRGLAYSTGSFYRARRDYGVFGAYAMTKSASAPTALQVIQDIMKNVKQDGLSPLEIDGAKKAILNSFIFQFDSLHQIVTQQALLAFDKLPADFLQQYRQRITLLTPSEIRKTAGNILAPEDSITLILGSEAGYRQIKEKYPDFKRIMVNYD
ncbi:MAG: insulinase family protein [Syntrophales bacterium]|jgi:predicted Zn-dependent peptidase|nr:insulinase family protein [Syntrophales bacterium]